MKNALLIHYYYPPIRSAAVSRNYYFSLEFVKLFSKVFVLTTSNRDILQTEVLAIPEEIDIVKCRTIDYRTIISFLSRDNHIAENRKQSALLKGFIKLQKTLPFNFLLGEGGFIYIINAYFRAKKIIDEQGISVIYSSFGPYADHLIAYYLKGHYPHIKWIADFRDLQIEPIYQNTFFSGWQKKIEKRILQRADLICTVSRGLAKKLENYDRPVVSMGRGVQLREYNQLPISKFTICYTGSLYQDYRDASYFFRELARFVKENNCEDLQFLHAGRDGWKFMKWAKEFNLGAHFYDLGYLSRGEVVEVQNSSHVQLLLTSSSEELGGVLTGKFSEYMESGNPILVLVKGARDSEFEKIISRTKAGMVCYDPPVERDTLYDFLYEHYIFWKETGTKKQTLDRKFVKENLSWEVQHAKLFKALEV